MQTSNRSWEYCMRGDGHEKRCRLGETVHNDTEKGISPTNGNVLTGLWLIFGKT